MDKPPEERILVFTREHIGDLVCSTPAIRSLRRLYPHAAITVDVGERAACVLENNPRVDRLKIRRDHQGLTGKFRDILWMRRQRFSHFICLNTSQDAVLHAWIAGIPRRSGLIYKKRFSRLWTQSTPFQPLQHEMIDNFLNIVRMLGGEVSDCSPEVFPSRSDCDTVSQLFDELGIEPGDTLIAFNPGASAPANRWLPDRFAELGNLLLDRTQAKIVLLGGQEDLTAAEHIASNMRNRPLMLTGRLTVLQLAEAIKRCNVMVTGDTGPMHLACAVKTPVVALFGPAVPHESGPGYMDGNVVIRNVPACPGCDKYVCRNNRKCMIEITADEVANAVMAQLQRDRFPLAKGSKRAAVG